MTTKKRNGCKKTIAARCVVGGIMGAVKPHLYSVWSANPSLNAVYEALKCMYLRLAAAKSRKNESDVDRRGGEISRTAAWKWVRVVSFENMLSTVLLFGRVLLCIYLLQTGGRVTGFTLVVSFESLGRERREQNGHDKAY